MYKKRIQIITMLFSVFLFSQTLMAMYSEDPSHDKANYRAVSKSASLEKTGAEEWKDEFGKPAPARVRRSADKLWDAVAIEDLAGWEAGLCTRKNKTYLETCGCLSCINSCLSCGIYECVKCCYLSTGDQDEVYWANDRRGASAKALDAIYQERSLQSKKALDEFKDAVNSSVKKPEQYSGDFNLQWVNYWVASPDWRKQEETLWTYIGARRDLSFVIQITKDFVHSHGGWISEETINFTIAKNDI